MRAGRGRAPWRATGAAILACILCVLETRAEEVMPLVVSPAGRDVEMRVGQRRGFSAVLAESDAEYAWSLDGAASGKGSRFEFRPTAAFVGRHEIAVTALAGSVAARHTWLVTVEAVGPPTIVRATPDPALVRVPAGEPLSFELQVEPAVLTDRVTIRWSVEGVPVGGGARLTLRAPASGTQRVRAVATSEYGGAAMREWQVVASAATEAVTSPPPPPRVVDPAPKQVKIERRPAVEKPTLRGRPDPAKGTAKVAAAKAAAPAKKKAVAATPPPGVTEADVRALMARYEKAWRTRDVRALRRMGHVDTDDQEQVLVAYFDTSRDLEVAVHVLEVHLEDGRGVVRFTQHDGFRDAAGRAVSAESAPIEKTVVRTRQGLRFAPDS